jgi:hypothetical protein
MVTEESFICMGTDCGFNRGGTMDYLKELDGDYAGALKTMSSLSPNHIWPKSHVRFFENRRRLLEFVLRQERMIYDTDVEKVRLRSAYGAFERYKPEHVRGLVHFLNTSEARELIELMGDNDLDIPTNLSSATILIPYWKNHHTISHLWTVTKDLRTTRITPVDPCRFSWFGLPQANPRATRFDIFHSYGEAGLHRGMYSSHHPEFYPTNLMVDMTQQGGGFMPSSMVFHHSPDKWEEHLTRWSSAAMSAIECHFSEDGEELLTINELLERMVERAVADHTFGDFVELVETLHLTPAGKTQVLEAADRHASPSQIHFFKSRMTRRLILEDDFGRLYETVEGYEKSDAKGGGSRIVSNFTMSINAVVWFSVDTDIAYQGTFTVGPVTIPFELPSRKFELATSLERALQPLQVAYTAQSTGTNSLATVVDKSGFKRVIEHLRACASQAPRKRGIRNLGWTRKHDRFHTPAAVVTATEIMNGVIYHPSDDSDIHCYKSDMAELPGDFVALPPISPEMAEVIASLVAGVCRYYHNLRVNPLGYRSTPSARRDVIELFSCLGQVDYHRPSNFLPRNFEDNRGMPYAISGINHMQAERITACAVYLEEQGELFPEGEDMLLASELLTWLCHKTARNLMSNRGSDFSECRSVSRRNSLAMEGASYIRKLFFPGWAEPCRAYPNADKVLDRTPEETAAFMGLDVERSHYLFSPEIWKTAGVNREDFALELTLLAGEMEERGEGVSVDAASGFRLLENYYGTPPKIEALRVG